MKEITYKLVTKTPMIIPHAVDGDGRLYIPASVLRGSTQFQFKELRDKVGVEQLKYVDSTRDLLFGDFSYKANLLFTDAVCGDQKNTENRSFFHRYTTGKVSSYSQPTIPAGAEFTGKVHFDDNIDGLQRSMALSAILDISNIGSLTSRHYRPVTIQVMDRSNPIVFISYAWENIVHISFVKSLAMRLMENKIVVALDRLVPTYDEKVPQDNINIYKWMTAAISNSDNILAVLTPQYKEKAEKNIGCVGFEFNRILSEKSLVSQRAKRYVGILKRGNKNISVPYHMLDSPIIDMRTVMDINAGLSDLIQMIVT